MMKPTLLIAISLWITFALFVAVVVLLRGRMNGDWFVVLSFAFAGLMQLAMAIRCTRAYLRGKPFPAGWQPDGAAGLARRERVRARIAAGRNPR